MNRHAHKPNAKKQSTFHRSSAERALRALRLAMPLAACTVAMACGPTDSRGAGKEDTATTHQELYFAPVIEAWPNGNVSICYNPNAYDPNLYGYMQRIFADSWGRAANVHLIDYGACTFGNPIDVVMIDFVKNTNGSTSFRGHIGDQQNLVALVSNDTTNGPILTHFVYEVIHEFGHVLGFAHEQERPDNWNGGTWKYCGQTDQGKQAIGGGTYETSFDAYSIMDYCNPTVPFPVLLSPGDIAGVRKVYGRNTSAHGFMITSDTNSHLAINAWGGAKAGTVLRLYGSCTSSKPDCTWSYRNGMLLSDTDPTLAINAYGGARQGTVLELTPICMQTNPSLCGGLCTATNPDCTWTYKQGMFISDRDPTLAINAYGGANPGTVLELDNACDPTNPDCTWTSHGVMFTNDQDPVMALNAYGGATNGGNLAVDNACDVSNPDCTFTIFHGIMESDRNASLAVNAWGGARPGANVVLTNLCTYDNPDCQWTWSKGQILSNNGSGLSMYPGGYFNGMNIILAQDCTVTDCNFSAQFAH